MFLFSCPRALPNPNQSELPTPTVRETFALTVPLALGRSEALNHTATNYLFFYPRVRRRQINMADSPNTSYPWALLVPIGGEPYLTLVGSPGWTSIVWRESIFKVAETPQEDLHDIFHFGFRYSSTGEWQISSVHRWRPFIQERASSAPAGSLVLLTNMTRVFTGEHEVS